MLGQIRGFQRLGTLGASVSLALAVRIVGTWRLAGWTSGVWTCRLAAVRWHSLLRLSSPEKKKRERGERRSVSLKVAAGIKMVVA